MNSSVNAIENAVISAGLHSRQERIQEAQVLLQRTQSIFERFGGDELKSSHAKFAELSRSLEADRNVMLVFVGEFSRGKSSLVNALLGIKLLRHAQEATTAINTFVRALPAGRTERFIRVHFVDGQSAQEIAWTDASALERWSTELDALNADARLSVDRIEIFMQHPLLDLGLVLIDTPGLESMVQHHEEITRRAIAEAHIAVWVQSALQLGANASEWKFVAGTLRKDFSKFITVVNMWDVILDTPEGKSEAMSDARLSDLKLEHVRANFRKQLHDQPEAELALMTDQHHLMGVSAAWALSDDEHKRARSGVDLLSKRISDMFCNGEALEQIYLKPLKQLAHIQEQLSERIATEQRQLASTDTEEQRARDLALLDEEIKNLELEMRTLANGSAVEHTRAARHRAREIEHQLIAPLANLKAQVEIHLTVGYIESQVAKKVKKIGLPANVAREFEDVVGTVNQLWQKERQLLAESLEGLRAEYEKSMAQHAKQLNTALGEMHITLPKLDVGFDLDLSLIEDHHAQALELEQTIAEREDELERLRLKVQQNAPNERDIEMARIALERAESQLDRLGGQPAPRTGNKSVKRSGGMYSSDRYENEEYLDYSNVDSWKEDFARQQENLADKTARMEFIKQQELQKSGVRLSDEAALRKYEKELQTFNRKKQAAEQARQDEQQHLVSATLAQLTAATVGQLQQRISYLQEHVSGSVQQLYDNQLALLHSCVSEQFVEPLSDKRAQREAVHQLLQQGQADVARREQQLQAAQQELAQLVQQTQATGR